MTEPRKVGMYLYERLNPIPSRVKAILRNDLPIGWSSRKRAHPDMVAGSLICTQLSRLSKLASVRASNSFHRIHFLSPTLPSTSCSGSHWPLVIYALVSRALRPIQTHPSSRILVQAEGESETVDPPSYYHTGPTLASDISDGVRRCLPDLPSCSHDSKAPFLPMSSPYHHRTREVQSGIHRWNRRGSASTASGPFVLDHPLFTCFKGYPSQILILRSIPHQAYVSNITQTRRFKALLSACFFFFPPRPLPGGSEIRIVFGPRCSL